MRIDRKGLLSALPLILSLCACSERATVSYRVDVSVHDQGGDHHGSSIWTTVLTKPWIGLDSPYEGRFIGNAVEIDLNDKSTKLYMLPSGRDEGEEGLGAMLPERVFSTVPDRIGAIGEVAQKIGKQKQLPCALLSDQVNAPSLTSSDSDCLLFAISTNNPAYLKVLDPLEQNGPRANQITIKDVRLTIVPAQMVTSKPGLSRDTILPVRAGAIFDRSWLEWK